MTEDRNAAVDDLVMLHGRNRASGQERSALSGGDLTPERFLDHFRHGRTDEIEGRSVRGNVSLYGETITRAVRALDVTFWGEVDFSECRFERSVDLSGCHFAKTLSFRNTQVGGSLLLDKCLVRTESSAAARHLTETRSIDLSGLRVENDLSLDHLTVEFGRTATTDPELRGMLHAANMHVGGRFDMKNIWFDGSLDMSGGRFTGDVTIATQKETSTEENLAVIRGWLQARNCRFEGNIILNGVQIGLDANFWSSICDGIFFARTVYQKDDEIPTRIGGDLNLAVTRIAYFDAEALHVAKRLTAFAATFGQFRLSMSKKAVAPSRFGQLVLVGNSFDGDLTLGSLVVTGDHMSAQHRGVRIQHCSIGGSLGFWGFTAHLDHEGQQRIDPAIGPDDLGAVIHGDLSIVGCRIGGELDLTNLTATGRIVLDDTKITRDVHLRSVATARSDLERAGVELGCPKDAGRLVTRAQALSMTNLVCSNEVDLTGLRLIEDDYPDVRDRAGLDKPRQGQVDARGCEIRKALRLFRAFDDRRLCPEGDPCPGSHAEIPGALNLADAKLGELILTHKGFEPDDPARRPAEVGLVLANAVIDEFELAEVVTTDGHLQLPKPMDLRDVTVNHWQILPPGEENRGLLRHQAFLDLIDTDPVFRRQTFIAIEQDLRNRGFRQDADAIYRKMVEREYEEQLRNRRMHARQSLFGRIFGWIGDWTMRRPLQGMFSLLLGYGTDPLRLLAVILAFWAAMLPMFLTGDNFEPSLAMLGAEATRYPLGEAPEADKPPADWSTLSGIAASLRYHLPVVALTVRDEWDPRETGATCYGSFGQAPASASPGPCGWITLPFSPEDLALLIAILNWIAWPFVLAFAINRFLRVDRN